MLKILITNDAVNLNVRLVRQKCLKSLKFFTLSYTVARSMYILGIALISEPLK